MNEEAKAAIEQIRLRDGILKPEAVVEEARNEASPLHDRFEWNDGEAAAQYRLVQARTIIQTIRTVGGDGPKVRTYENVRITKDERGYIPRQTILSEADMRAQLVGTAREDLRKWCVHYQGIDELSELWNFIQSRI